MGLTVLLAISVSHAWAEPAKFRDADAHQHGHATLGIAADGDTLQMELHTPMANIAGFEHEPETPAQEKKLKEAIETLRDGGSLFIPNGKARCKLVSTQIIEPQFKTATDKHDDHKHDDDHDTHHDGEEHDSHADLTTTYIYQCKRLSKLARIETRIFSEFQGMEKIEVSYLGPDKQTSADLSAASPTFRID